MLVNVWGIRTKKYLSEVREVGSFVLGGVVWISFGGVWKYFYRVFLVIKLSLVELK